MNRTECALYGTYVLEGLTAIAVIPNVISPPNNSKIVKSIYLNRTSEICPQDCTRLHYGLLDRLAYAHL
jgi:hypothetical protein